MIALSDWHGVWHHHGIIQLWNYRIILSTSGAFVAATRGTWHTRLQQIRQGFILENPLESDRLISIDIKWQAAVCTMWAMFWAPVSRCWCPGSPLGHPSSRLQRVSGPGDTLPTAPPPLIVYTCKESNLEIDRIENIKYIWCSTIHDIYWTRVSACPYIAAVSCSVIRWCWLRNKCYICN